MEAIFDRAPLCAAIHSVSAAISTRSPRPVLQCVHVETRNGDIIFSATDLNIAVRCSVTPKELKSAGKGLIVGTKLDGLLREALEEEILLKIGEGEAEIRAGRSRFRLVTQDVADYPELPEFPGAAVTISAAKADELARRTVFAVAEEGGRYAIDGVCMFVEGGRMEYAGTDGRRLAVSWTEVDKDAKIERCVVSKELLGRIRALTALGEPVDLAVEKGRLLARAGGVLVAGSLLEGTFPAYMDMVPEEAGEKVALSASLFASKLRQASQLTTDESRAVTFRIESDRMIIESKSAALGEGSIEIGVTYSGEPVQISFNPQFLLQALGEFEDCEFAMEIISGEKPVVLRREGFIYVVAPVRVR